MRSFIWAEKQELKGPEGNKNPGKAKLRPNQSMPKPKHAQAKACLSQSMPKPKHAQTKLNPTHMLVRGLRTGYDFSSLVFLSGDVRVRCIRSIIRTRTIDGMDWMRILYSRY